VTLDEARPLLVEAGRRLLAEGLVSRSWGNLSLRLDDGTMAVTPSGIPYPDLRGEMISAVHLETGAWSGAWKPSGERKVHAELYRRRPDLQAVIHTHQSAASACAALRRPVPTPAGPIPCAAYALPGTKALTRATADAFGSGTAVLMANHGVFVGGSSLEGAFDRIRSLEAACAGWLAGQTPGPAAYDSPWDDAWVTSTRLADHTPALVSRSPFVLAWADRRKPLRARLDDLAQLAGAAVPTADALPVRARRIPAVLVPGLGLAAWGEDAEALVQVAEKAARAAWAAEAQGGARTFPGWEARLMRLVYRQVYRRQAEVTSRG